ncbi:MAG: LPS assembly lipoprotein LptE [Rhodoferax sp.]|uniref:LPS-assembly lipoprotein LptE n=1 Tax=Rhodoferax sp. TaxID=50421 RepID=UPI00260EA513|nr:LPS assembly lipoprotein LptE [Rhodoferax sp.]MDD5332833.1 LPS assembly lipoprotein LptE [Rhodoferax sp.]
MQRRSALALLRQFGLAGIGSLALAGCGFKLRASQNFSFSTLAVLPNPGGPLALELRRSVAGAVRVLAPGEALTQAQLVIDILQEQREKVVVAVNSSGQVREFQLRIRLKFKIRTPLGHELVPDTDMLQQRDISFNESAALAKEAEEGLLYRDMQTDLVQQLLRRLATVRLD